MIQITMPRLSDTMQEGAISAWHKHPGDTVDVGDLLVEIETDKATMEYEAYDAGTLTEILVPEGENVSIGTPIATLDDGTNTPTAPDSHENTSPTTADVGETPPPDQLSASSSDQGTPSSEQPAPVPLPPSPTDPSQDRTAFASPLARKLARDNHVDLHAVHGSGPGGRLVRSDIQAVLDGIDTVIPEPHTDAPRPVAITEMADNPADSTAPMTGIRKVIARRLAESARTIPHFTVTAIADVEALLELRTRVNASLVARGQHKVSINDFVIKAAAAALREHPDVNVSYDEDPEPAIIDHGHINIGIAIAAPSGLVVPVISDADTRSVSSIGAASRNYSAAAAARKLAPADMTGGTFTVSNLGMYGVDSFTAIINPPESAILAVGAAAPEVVAIDGAPAVRRRLKYTLSADHRVIDGALAAQFLRTFTRLLEDPLSIIA